MVTLTEKYDLVVLGQGAAAFAAVTKASDLEAKAVMVGRNATPGAVLGGTCVNVGCVPSKRLLVSGEMYSAGDRFEGVSVERHLDFRLMMKGKDRLVGRLRNEKYRDVLGHLDGVSYVNESASFRTSHEIRAGKRLLSAKKVLIATGASTLIPTLPGVEKLNYYTNEDALSLRAKPESMVVIGGGPLGVEFAQMYANFGTKVTLLQRGERILPREEPEVSELLRRQFEESGIGIHVSSKLLRAEKKGRKSIIYAGVKGRRERFEADSVLFATGRKPHTEELNLSAAGVRTDERGFVLADESMQTSSPDVFAAGDVVGEPMLETVAAKEGATAAENAIAGNRKKVDYSAIPHAVFTYPQVASVGLTEEETLEKFGTCSCRVLSFEAVPKAMITEETGGVIKMVIRPKTHEIVGIHILAPNAAEIIHAGVMIIRAHMTIDDVIDTVFTFPTFSESIKLAAQSFYKDVSKLSCCTE
jgi:mercuric reductase